MQVRLPGGLQTVADKVLQKKPVEKTPQAEIKQANTLSFMSIPSIAFKGNLVVPKLPKGMSASPKPTISMQDMSMMTETVSQPTVKYLVNPQDPLITKPEIYTMKGEVAPGPEGARVKTVDKSEKATPSAQGSYIADINTPQFDRVNAYVFTQQTLQNYEEALGRKIPWAFPSEQIDVFPLAGETMNAYYSRWDQQIKLFYFDSRTKPVEKCFTSKMADVVVHETGHAVLDGLRPSYIGWGSHGGAIHEGFGDSSSMLAAMGNKTVVDKVIKQTGGDLRQENYIASLAEQFGKAVYGNKMYLRNAINDLKLSDFESGKESTEVHNFGRLYAALFYDIIEEVAKDKAKIMPLNKALMETSKDLTKLLVRAMGDFSPPGSVYYTDAALALLKAEEKDFGGQYKDILVKILLNRDVLRMPEIKAWEAEQKNLPDMQLMPNSLKSQESIIDFVNDNKALLNLPATNNYQLESAYNNEFGEVFIQLKSPVKIDVPNYPGFQINLYDGVTLGFDKGGKLFYKAENQTQQFEIDNALADVKAELKKLDDAQKQGITIQPTLYRSNEEPNVLVKMPKIEEPQVV